MDSWEAWLPERKQTVYDDLRREVEQFGDRIMALNTVKITVVYDGAKYEFERPIEPHEAGVHYRPASALDAAAVLDLLSAQARAALTVGLTAVLTDDQDDE